MCAGRMVQTFPHFKCRCTGAYLGLLHNRADKGSHTNHGQEVECLGITGFVECPRYRKEGPVAAQKVKAAG